MASSLTHAGPAALRVAQTTHGLSCAQDTDATVQSGAISQSVCVSGWIQGRSQELQNWVVLMKPRAQGLDVLVTQGHGEFSCLVSSWPRFYLLEFPNLGR